MNPAANPVMIIRTDVEFSIIRQACPEEINIIL